MLKKESMDGEPFLTTDPILAEKPPVLAYQQEVESKFESCLIPFWSKTYQNILTVWVLILSKQWTKGSKKKEEESNTTNIAEKHTLTYFDDKPVSQPASSSDTATWR